MSLVMKYMGSRLKLLMMSWYRSMKQFRTKLKLDINKYFCRLHEYFHKVDSSSNDVMLSEMSKYIYSYNFNRINFDIYIYI